MKKVLVLITLFSLLFPLASYAQDVITKTFGEVVESKGLEISKEEIKFKKYDNLGGIRITTMLT